MKASLDKIKIEMTFEEGVQLKEQIYAMINEVKVTAESLSYYFDEVNLRETYPKVNELLQILNVRDEIPF